MPSDRPRPDSLRTRVHTRALTTRSTAGAFPHAVKASLAAPFALLLAWGLSACAPHTSTTDGDPTSLTVFAASSTRVMNDDFARLYDDASRNSAQSESLATSASSTHSAPLHIVNAGSSALVQQLHDGAPADVLITADRRTTDQALADATVPDPQPIASNALVMVVPAHAGRINSVNNLDDIDTVLCDPHVPCGAAAQAVREDAGLEFEVASYEQSVGDALGKVTSGQADAAWVYRTDALAAGDAVRIIEIPRAHDHPTQLYAAVTTTAQRPAEAQAFIDALRSSAATWRDHGFLPPPNPTTSPSSPSNAEPAASTPKARR